MTENNKWRVIRSNKCFCGGMLYRVTGNGKIFHLQSRKNGNITWKIEKSYETEEFNYLLKIIDDLKIENIGMILNPYVLEKMIEERL